MIMSVVAALSLLRTMEQLNELAPPVVQAGPVGKEIEAVKELQSRVSNIMWNEHSKGASTMLRWLRAKKMDVNAAEKMIRDHIEWRKKLDIDKLRMKEADPKMLKRFWYNMTGFARNDNPVMLMSFGAWDIRTYVDGGGTREEFDRHQGQMWEKALAAVEYVEQRPRKPRKDDAPVQYIMVCNLAGFAYRQLASYQSDWAFEMLLRIIRPLMTGSIEKLKVYGSERAKWEKVVRKQIDPAVLPYAYGGYSKKEREKLKLPMS